MFKHSEKIENALTEHAIPYNTAFAFASIAPLKVGGEIDMLVTIENEPALLTVYNLIKEYEVPWFALGEGKYILLSDKGFPGIALKLAGDYARFEIQDNTIDTGAAVPLERIAREARVKKLEGLEFASILPGSIGGCILKNSSSFGKSISDVIDTVTILTGEGVLKTLSRDEIVFSGNTSNLRGTVILSARFNLTPEPDVDIHRMTEKFRYVRGVLLPTRSSTGLVFDDADDHKAYQMIERVGAAKLNYNGASWYTSFPNYIVVESQTTANDIYRLIIDTQKMVFQHYNYNLEILLNIIGTFENEA